MMMASHTIFYLLFISCNVCYDYQSDAASVPPTNTTASPGKGAISTGTIDSTVEPISLAVLIFMVGLCYLIKRIRNKYGFDPEGLAAININNMDSLQYDFRTIEAATNNFSADNKIGSGGFGEVYKGMLLNGQEIAVKRLFVGSRQGDEEFKNEVEVLAKLQHNNLVRLLGFCVQGPEKMLVHEYVPNKTLECILFDLENKKRLDWTKRYKIIKGIAQSIQYLHDDSRLKIIHRDLEASKFRRPSNGDCQWEEE